MYCGDSDAHEMSCWAVVGSLYCVVSLHFEAISMDHAERIDELEARLHHEVATRERLEKELQESESRFRIAIQAMRESEGQHKKQAEEKLPTTQEYLDAILLNLPVGVAILEGPDFRYYRINHQLAEINGLSVEDHLGRPLEEVLPDAATDIVPRLRQVMESGEPSSPFEFSTKLPKCPDEVFWFVDTFFPINDTNGEVRGIGAVVLEVTARKRAEIALQEAYGELARRVQERTQQVQKTQKELFNLSRHLIRAQEEERRRIALELHDQLGQDLALLSIEIEQLNQKAPQFQAKQLQKLTTLATKVASQVQTLSHQLHPSTLTHLGLVAASRSLCQEVSESSDIQIDFSHSDVSRSIPQDVSTCLFRVLQESLTNVVKHSGAKTAQVELAGSPSEIQLQILDSGVGFDPRSTGSRGGLGLLSMRERLNLLGGELLIESRPSGNTWIKAGVPLKSSASPD